MFTKTYASAVHGINAVTITVEADVTKGIKFLLVGLADNAVKESQQRIESALRLIGLKWPKQKIVINMAPADIRKEGASYDLPLAIAILAASGQIRADNLDKYLMMGELSLDGSLQPVKGVLPIAINARKEGFGGFILPRQNAREAAVVDKLKIYGVENLKEVISFLNGEIELQQTLVDARSDFLSCSSHSDIDFSDVKGQENVKRALEIAAAGSHNIILNRSTRVWKDHAGQADTYHPASFYPQGGPGNHQDTFGCRKNWPGYIADDTTAIPESPPYNF
jgi:magnesium chelatase family protein